MHLWMSYPCLLCWGEWLSHLQATQLCYATFYTFVSRPLRFQIEKYSQNQVLFFLYFWRQLCWIKNMMTMSKFLKSLFLLFSVCVFMYWWIPFSYRKYPQIFIPHIPPPVNTHIHVPTHNLYFVMCTLFWYITSCLPLVCYNLSRQVLKS